MFATEPGVFCFRASGPTPVPAGGVDAKQRHENRGTGVGSIGFGRPHAREECNHRKNWFNEELHRPMKNQSTEERHFERRGKHGELQSHELEASRRGSATI
jgi:hypothetical protein